VRRPPYDPAWPAAVAEIYRNDLREMWEPELEPHSYNSYQAQLSLFLKLADSYAARSILDIGCAQGTLALLLAESGRRVVGVDIRPEFLKYAQSRYEKGTIEFSPANIMDRPPLGSFDVVFANQILEHVVRPAKFLEVARSYLNPRGIIVVTTPNQEYLRAGLPSYSTLGDPNQYAALENSAGGGDHFFFYTASELGRIAREARLRVISLAYFESPWISGHMKVRYLHRLCPVSWLRAADRLTLAMAGRRLGRHLCLLATVDDSVPG
jgi:SAM-dependent methyltransferase